MRKVLHFGAVCAALSSLPYDRARAGDEIVDPPAPRRELRANERQSSPNNRVSTGLDDVDAVAVLEGIRIALTEVGDGGSYVWHRRDGVLSGMAQPTKSFKDAAGQPCRNLTVMLNTYGRSSRIEGTACRTTDDRWILN